MRGFPLNAFSCYTFQHAGRKTDRRDHLNGRRGAAPGGRDAQAVPYARWEKSVFTHGRGV